MESELDRQIAALQGLGVADLRARYAGIFGESLRTGNKAWLAKRIAWRLQAQAEGGLSERARRRALEIANDADLRIRAPRTMFGQDPTLNPKLSVTRKVAGDLDSRLPPHGSFLEREYKGRRIIVKVLVDGFEFEGRAYRSLSAIAREVTGTKWNGFHFFSLSPTQEAADGKK